MAQTLLQVQRQIEKLRQDEEKLKKAEAAGVIERIKVAIAAYSLRPEDLFGDVPAGRRSNSVAGTTKGKSKSKLSQVAQYADEKGNEWVGRGPRPLWLREAIAAGKSLADFSVGQPSQATIGKAGDRKAGATKATKKSAAIKYRDDSGNSWSGRGSQPRWLRAQLAEGKKLEQFQV